MALELGKYFTESNQYKNNKSQYKSSLLGGSVSVPIYDLDQQVKI